MTAVHRKQQQEEERKSQAPGGVLQARSDRRGRSNNRAAPPGGGSSSQSIFQKKGGKNSSEVKSFLDDYLPPKNFRISPQEAKEKWKSLSDLESGKMQGTCMHACIHIYMCCSVGCVGCWSW